jgi:hypothetical protein
VPDDLRPVRGGGRRLVYRVLYGPVLPVWRGMGSRPRRALSRLGGVAVVTGYVEADGRAARDGAADAASDSGCSRMGGRNGRLVCYTKSERVQVGQIPWRSVPRLRRDPSFWLGAERGQFTVWCHPEVVPGRRLMPGRACRARLFDSALGGGIFRAEIIPERSSRSSTCSCAVCSPA